MYGCNYDALWDNSLKSVFVRYILNIIASGSPCTSPSTEGPLSKTKYNILPETFVTAHIIMNPIWSQVKKQSMTCNIVSF